jgi:hypothetical protein
VPRQHLNAQPSRYRQHPAIQTDHIVAEEYYDADGAEDGRLAQMLVQFG